MRDREVRSGGLSGRPVGWKHATRLSGLMTLVLVIVGVAAPVEAAVEQPVGLKVRRGSCLFGNARTTKSPAVVDYSKCLKATPEGRKIEEEGIQKGSAQYSILMSKAGKRVRKTIKKIAVREKRDCVIKKGGIRNNPDGLEVTDLTDEVCEELSQTDEEDG